MSLPYLDKDWESISELPVEKLTLRVNRGKFSKPLEFVAGNDFDKLLYDLKKSGANILCTSKKSYGNICYSCHAICLDDDGSKVDIYTLARLEVPREQSVFEDYDNGKESVIVINRFLGFSIQRIAA